jgi:hypothetical protein
MPCSKEEHTTLPDHVHGDGLVMKGVSGPQEGGRAGGSGILHSDAKADACAYAREGTLADIRWLSSHARAIVSKPSASQSASQPNSLPGGNRPGGMCGQRTAHLLGAAGLIQQGRPRPPS